jgi:hypothetical protein
MNLKQCAVPALALFLGTAGLVTTRAFAAPQGPPPPGYGQERGGWDEPPRELNEIQRQGFHDGIEGARRDFDNHRRPNATKRDEYRHPPVPHDQRDAYRDGFRRGYDHAMSHLMGGPGRY